MMVIKIKIVIITKKDSIMKNKIISIKINIKIEIITKIKTKVFIEITKISITNMIDLTKDKKIIKMNKTTIINKFIKKENVIISICDVYKNYSG